MKARIFLLLSVVALSLSCGGEDDPKPINPEEQKQEEEKKQKEQVFIDFFAESGWKVYGYSHSKLIDWKSWNESSQHLKFGVDCDSFGDEGRMDETPLGFFNKVIFVTKDHRVSTSFSCDPSKEPEKYTWSIDGDTLFLPDGAMEWRVVSIEDSDYDFLIIDTQETERYPYTLLALYRY